MVIIFLLITLTLKADSIIEWVSLEEFSAKNSLNFEWSPGEERGKILNEKSQIAFLLDERYALLEARNDSRLIWLSQHVSLNEGQMVISSDDAKLILEQFSPAAKTNPSKGSENKTSLFTLKRIIVDPGHGGEDHGAARGKYREKDVTLAVANKLAKLISDKTKFEAVITRNRDVFISLPERARIASQYKADETLFVSIHCNSVRRGSSAKGVESYVFDLSASDSASAALAIRENAGEKVDYLTYILSDLRHRASEPYSLEAARQIQKSITSKLHLEDRSIKRAPFYVLSKTNMPAILVELGFISNKVEQQMLASESYQQQFAEAILQGIMDFERSIVHVN